MIQGRLRKGKITAWLLPVVLVLSLFTFSGISSPSNAKLHKTTTEQIDRVRVSNKKCASFKIAGHESTSKLDYSAVSFQQIALSHTLNFRMQVKQCTRNSLEFIALNYSLLQYPQRTSEEDFSISQIG